LCLGIKAAIKGDTITFSLDKPAKLTIEINNSIHRALHLFANPLEVNPPGPKTPGVIYFPAGIYKVGQIDVASNQTVYIAGGAVVYGWVTPAGVNNVKIIGRGILNGSIYDRWADTKCPISVRSSSNVTVDGICIFNPSAWSLEAYQSTNVTFNNVKIISARPNGDGITVQSCTDFKCTDCFVRSWDDSLVVKGYDGEAANYVFDNIQIWTDLAQSCEVGYETRAYNIHQIYFKNITVLHNFHKPVISLHNSDNALVSDIHYENIIVEDAEMGQGDGDNYLIDIWIGPSVFAGDNRGNIRDVYIKNVKVLGGNFPSSRIVGYDAVHTAENIDISNVNILGTEVTGLASGKIETNEFAKQITFGNVTPYPTVTLVPTPSPTPKPAIENLALNKKITTSSAIQNYIAMNATDGSDTTYWEGAADSYPNTVDLDLGAITAVSSIKIKLNPNSLWGQRTQTFSVFGSTDGNNYSPIVDSATYTFDPAANSNIVAVPFATQKIQYLRLIFTANSGGTAGQIAELEVYP
jgi:F5/8 type C domain/Glycosyl hydrolases family 28